MPRSAAKTKRRILDAAYELFYRKGFNRVGVDEIAAASGVTKRSLYYHFKSKDELLGSVLELQHELSLARIRKYEDRYKGDPAESWRSCLPNLPNGLRSLDGRDLALPAW